jgi:hypothetical protein
MGTVTIGTPIMDTDELNELQDPATWDDATDEVLDPATSPRAIVEVAFTTDEFAHLARFARAHGESIAQVIRDATIAHLALETVSPAPPART